MNGSAWRKGASRGWLPFAHSSGRARSGILSQLVARASVFIPSPSNLPPPATYECQAGAEG